MSEIADAITGTVTDMFGSLDQTEDTPVVAAPKAEVPQPEPASTEPPADDDTWDFESAGRELFQADEEEPPDFSLEAENELQAEEDEFQVTEYDDDQTRELKKRFLAEKKKSEYYARQAHTASRKSWEADVRKQPWSEFLPKDLSKVKANSHRDFLRQVREIARTNYEVLKPHYERLAAEKAKLRETATVEARAQAEQAWGKPSVGTFQVPADPEAERMKNADDQMKRALATRNMNAVTKLYIDNGWI